MKITIEVYDIDPTNDLHGTGPADEYGNPTVTPSDFAAAKAASDRGERYYFGRISWFRDSGADPKNGLQTAYISPPSADRTMSVVSVLGALKESLLNSGLLEDKR